MRKPAEREIITGPQAATARLDRSPTYPDGGAGRWKHSGRPNETADFCPSSASRRVAKLYKREFSRMRLTTDAAVCSEDEQPDSPVRNLVTSEIRPSCS